MTEKKRVQMSFIAAAVTACLLSIFFRQLLFANTALYNSGHDENQLYNDYSMRIPKRSGKRVTSTSFVSSQGEVNHAKKDALDMAELIKALKEVSFKVQVDHENQEKEEADAGKEVKVEKVEDPLMAKIINSLPKKGKVSDNLGAIVLAIYGQVNVHSAAANDHGTTNTFTQEYARIIHLYNGIIVDNRAACPTCILPEQAIDPNISVSKCISEMREKLLDLVSCDYGDEVISNQSATEVIARAIFPLLTLKYGRPPNEHLFLLAMRAQEARLLTNHMGDLMTRLLVHNGYLPCLYAIAGYVTVHSPGNPNDREYFGKIVKFLKRL